MSPFYFWIRIIVGRRKAQRRAAAYITQASCVTQLYFNTAELGWYSRRTGGGQRRVRTSHRAAWQEEEEWEAVSSLSFIACLGPNSPNSWSAAGSSFLVNMKSTYPGLCYIDIKLFPSRISWAQTKTLGWWKWKKRTRGKKDSRPSQFWKGEFWRPCPIPMIGWIGVRCKQ